MAHRAMAESLQAAEFLQGLQNVSQLGGITWWDWAQMLNQVSCHTQHAADAQRILRIYHLGEYPCSYTGYDFIGTRGLIHDPYIT